MANWYNKYEKDLLPLYKRLRYDGYSSKQANSYLKEKYGKGFRLQSVNAANRQFTKERTTQNNMFDSDKSFRLKVNDAIDVNLKSVRGFKYHIRFSANLLNPETGEMQRITNTIGLHKLKTTKEIKQLIKDRLNDMATIMQEQYSQYKGIFVLDSTQFEGFYRIKK